MARPDGGGDTYVRQHCYVNESKRDFVRWLLDRSAGATYLPAIHKSELAEEGSRHATAK
jgi:hypothetical protein